MRQPKLQPLRVLMATPLGEAGRGGIDQLNDYTVHSIRAQPELNVIAKRLVTRGQRGLFQAQLRFACSLVRFVMASLLGHVDVLDISLAPRGSCYRKCLLGAAARLLGVPYVIHLHGFGFGEFWSNTSRLFSSNIDRLFIHAECIIVAGQYWVDVLTEKLPSVASKIELIPNATPAVYLPRTAEEADNHLIRITFLGELGSRKGSFDLINSLALLTHRRDWTATLAGNGEIAETREALHRLGIADRVKVPGWLDVSAKNTLLEGTDILVLPSTAENLPIVIIEALARGIAIISTPVGAIPEVIQHERNGILVPVGDVEKLAAALEQLIEDDDLRADLGRAAKRDHAEFYDTDVYARRLVRVWRRAFAKR